MPLFLIGSSFPVDAHFDAHLILLNHIVDERPLIRNMSYKKLTTNSDSLIWIKTFIIASMIKKVVFFNLEK